MIVPGLTALILEDEVIVAFALEDMLLEMGVNVVMATTIEQAFAALDGEEVTFAVLDVNVHGVKSYGIAEALAERDIAFIFATGYGYAEHPTHFAQVPTLTKPYNRQQLAECLAGIV